MSVELNTVNAYTKSMAFSLPIEDYQKSYDKTLKKVAKRVSIPGFRKGKVPATILRKNYHDAIHGDTVESLIQKSFEAACQDNGVYPLGNVKVENMNFNEEKGLDYTISFEVKPEIDSLNYKNFDIEKPTRSVTEKDVEMAIENIRFQNSKLKDLSDDASIQEGSYVRMDVVELDENNQEKKNNSYPNIYIQIGKEEFDKDIEKDVIGLKVGDIKEIEKKYRKNHKNKELAGKTERFRVTINEVHERELPELTDEFVAEMNKDGSVKTVEELRNNISTSLKGRYDMEVFNGYVSNIAEKIVENNDIEIPASMLENYLERLYEAATKQRAVNEEKFKTARKESAVFELKWQLMKDFILKNEDIKIEDDSHEHKEVKEYVDTLSMSDQEKEFIKSNHQFLHEFEHRLLEKKLVDFLETVNKVKEKEVETEN